MVTKGMKVDAIKHGSSLRLRLAHITGELPVVTVTCIEVDSFLKPIGQAVIIILLCIK